MAALTSENKRSDFRLGLLVFLSLAVLIGGIIFAGGDKALLMKETSQVRTHINNVSGLKAGSGVTMGGMTIGQVKAIHFRDSARGPSIEVVMEIRADMRPRIKADAVTEIKTQGIMGDRYIEITIGSPEAPVLQPGQVLQGITTSEFDSTLRQARAVLQQTETLLAAVNDREGTFGKMVYDKGLYDEIVTLAAELRGLIQDFKEDPERFVQISVF